MQQQTRIIHPEKLLQQLLRPIPRRPQILRPQNTDDVLDHEIAITAARRGCGFQKAENSQFTSKEHSRAGLQRGAVDEGAGCEVLVLRNAICANV